MYFPRTLEPYWLKASEQFPVVMLTGARQVGKTTMLRHLCGDTRTYVTLDDPQIRELATQEPSLFLQRYTPPVLIDEFQYAPELLPYIKIAVDREQMKGGYWLTGSQQFHMMKDVSESLAGRAAIVHLLGASRNEIRGRTGRPSPFIPDAESIQALLSDAAPLPLPALYEGIWKGSFPAMSFGQNADRDLFFSSYVQTYLQRDIQDLAKVGDEMAFLRFVRAAASRTAQMLNISALARDADISPNTAKHWLSILTSSGLTYTLEPWHTNSTLRMVKSPKLYFLDTGLAAWLTGWSSPETLEVGAMSGPFLESWVVSEIIKSWFHTGKRPPLYYYRDKDKREIDLIIDRDGTLYPLEIKKTAAPGRNAVRHFSVLEAVDRSIGQGGILCLSEHYLPLTDRASVIPVSVL